MAPLWPLWLGVPRQGLPRMPEPLTAYPWLLEYLDGWEAWARGEALEGVAGLAYVDGYLDAMGGGAPWRVMDPTDPWAARVEDVLAPQSMRDPEDVRSYPRDCGPDIARWVRGRAGHFPTWLPDPPFIRGRWRRFIRGKNDGRAPDTASWVALRR